MRIRTLTTLVPASRKGSSLNAPPLPPPDGPHTGIKVSLSSPIAAAGMDRIVKELFLMPGQVKGKEGQIVKLRLKATHPFAKPMLACLKRVF
jgi:hypothetical protein